MYTVIELNTCSNTVVHILLPTSIEDKEISLIRGTESFTCKISCSDIEKFASSYEMNEADYLFTLTGLLSGQTKGSVISLDNEVLTLYKSSTSKAVFFSVPLMKANHDKTQKRFLDTLLQSNLVQKDTIDKLTSKNTDLEKKLDQMKVKLESCIESSLERENDILTCFVQVLNEKKKYIQFIKTYLSNDENFPQEDEFLAQQKTRKRRAQEDISDSETSQSEGDDNSENAGPSNNSGEAKDNAFDVLDDIEYQQISNIKLPKRVNMDNTQETIPIVSPNKLNESQNHNQNEVNSIEENSQKYDTPKVQYSTQALLDEL